MEVLDADSSTSTMPVGLFSPSDRLQGLLVEGNTEERNLLHLLHENFAHVELNELGGAGLETLVTSSCTWTDFLSFLSDKAAFLDENLLIIAGNDNVEFIGELYFFVSIEASFGTGLNTTHTARLNVYALPSSRMQATNICTALLQLLSRPNQQTSQPLTQVRLKSLWYDLDLPPNVSGPAIHNLLEQCPDLELLEFIDATLHEDQCRALVAASPTKELNIRFHDCRVLQADGTAALADVFRNNNNNNNQGGGRVHYHLHHFQTDDWSILAQGLGGGNTSLKTIDNPTGGLGERMLEPTEFRVLVEALEDNQGLVKFAPREQHIDLENWAILCRSLSSHPTLETLDLSDTFRPLYGIDTSVSNEIKTYRCKCILNLLQSNTVLRSIHLSRDERDEAIWIESILPHLQTRTYQSRVLEIKAVDHQPRRSKLFGRALYSVQTKPYLLYLFLIGNADIVTASHEARSRALD
jgi:hypothetical protein